MKRKKQLRRLSALFGLLAIFVGLILPSMLPHAPIAEAATDYKTVDIPSKLVTATSDAIVSVNSNKESTNGEGANGDTSNLMSSIATIVRAGNFGNFGLFYGQISSSKTDNYNALRGGSGVGRADIKDLDTRTEGQLSQYIEFGRAIQQMLNDASTSTDGRKKAVMAAPAETETEMRQMVSAFTKHAREFIGRVNPLPFFRAMGDSSILANPKYIAPSTGNFWIMMIHADPTIREFFNFIGGDAVRTMFGVNTTGGFKISMATMIVFVVAVFTFIFGVIGSFVGVGTTSNTGWGQALRRIGVRLTIAVVGFQLFVVFGGELEKLFNGEDTVAKVESNVVINVVKRNLNFEDWYAVGFALPPGVKIPIVDGKMLLTQDTILAINRYTAAKLKSGSYDEALAVPANPGPETDANGRPNLRNREEQIIYKQRKRAADVRGTVGDDVSYAYVRLVEAAKRLSFTPTFSAPATKNFGQVTIPGGATIAGGKDADTKWDVSALDNAATEIGSGKKLEDKTVNQIRSSEYVTSVGLQMKSVDGGYILSMPDNVSFGISPIAAYNLLNSSFDASGVTVNNNLQKRTLNTVIHNAQSTGIAKPSDNKSAVNTIVLIVLIYTAVVSLFKIVGSAVGGVLRGTSAAFGSAVGLGTLVGAIITLFVGTMVLALTIEITMNIMDELWAIIDTMFRDMSLDALNDVVEEVLKGIDAIPLIGPLVKWAVGGAADMAAGLVITLLMLSTMPRVLAVGIKVVANYFAGLPDEFGERARMMQEHFTGTRSYRGRDLGVAEELGAAIKSGQAGAKTLAKGATAIAGAGAAWAGSKFLDEAAKREAAEKKDFEASQAEESPDTAVDPNGPDDNPPTETPETPETTETTETPETTGAIGTADSGTVEGDSATDAPESPEVAEDVADGEAVAGEDGYDFDDEVAASIAQEQTSGGATPLGPDGKPLSEKSASGQSETPATGSGPTPPSDASDVADGQSTASDAPSLGENKPEVATGEAPTSDTTTDATGTPKTPNVPKEFKSGDTAQAGTTDTQTDATPTVPKATETSPNTNAQANGSAGTSTGTAADTPGTTAQGTTDDQKRPNIPMQTNTSKDPVVQEAQSDKKPEFKPSMGTRILANIGHGLRGASGGRDKSQVVAGAAQVVASIAGGGAGGKLVNDTLMRQVEQRRSERARTGAGDVEVEKRMQQTQTVTEEQAVRAHQRVNTARQAEQANTATPTQNWWEREGRPTPQATQPSTAERDEAKHQQEREQQESVRRQRESELERSVGDGFEQEYSAFDDYNDDNE